MVQDREPEARHPTADRVAAAAGELLVERGAAAVTMRAVGTAVGLSAMAIYKHFPNREALLRAVVDDELRKLSRTWGRRRESDDFEGRLLGLQDDFLDLALGKPHLYSFLITERREQARRFPHDFRDGGTPAFAPVHALVTEAIRQGVLKDGDPVEVTLALTSGTVGLVQFYLGGRVGLSEPEFRELCRRTIRRMLDGVRG